MFQTLEWRNQAVMRLETLRAKRSVSTLDTPSPPNKHFSRSLSTPTAPEERRLVLRSLLTYTQKENDPLVDKACPSSPHKHFSKAESTPSVREEHEYARMPTSDRARLEREQYEKRRRVPRSLLTDNQKEFGVWSFVLFNDAWSQKGHSASNTTVILA